MTDETKITAFKGFDKNMQCRGYQFEVGKTYEHAGPVKACARGFHACTNPFDVWSYYDMTGSRFAEVTLSGDTDTHDSDSKIAAGRITIEAELSLPEFIKRAVAWVVDQTKGKDESGDYAKIGSSGGGAQIGSSGDYAKIGSSGDDAKIGSSGDDAKIGSSGHYAQIGSSGDDAKIGSSGNGAKIGSSGNGAKIGSSGDYAKIGSSGDDAKIGSSGYGAKIGSSGYGAKIVAEGKNAVIACAGSATVTAGEGGAICVPYYDGTRTRFAFGYVGEDGIQAGVAYTARDGKLVEVV